MAQHDDFARLRIDLATHSVKSIAALGLETDHGRIVPGEYIVNDYSAWDRRQLEEAGIPYRVIIPDVSAWYANQNNRLEFRNKGCDQMVDFPLAVPDHYVPGSMGGYFTYEEMMDELIQMRTLYPELISPLAQIADYESIEGRPIYWFKVSDAPLTDENEPEILYTALHHAREPNSLSQMIFFLWYLLESYEENPEVKQLVDHSELYFIPCVNPDGYVYNEILEPNGGGLWRKNRRKINEDVYGVDLNRNYGFEWGHDDIGSSPHPKSQVYRGNNPFSEPETQAVRYFCEQHEFEIALNYHSYGNLLIHPWGYTEQPVPEDDLFKGLGEVITRANDFKLGNALETVEYYVNGSSDDWMYGDRFGKNKSYALTPEVGSDRLGFWPPSWAIDRLNKSCLRQNLNAAQLLHYYIDIRENGPHRLTSSEGEIVLELRRVGLKDGSAEVFVNAADHNVQVDADPKYIELDLLENTPYSFEYSIQVGNELIQDVSFEIIMNYGSYEIRDTLEKEYLNAETETLFADALDDATYWISPDQWELTLADYVSPPFSYTDNPNGPYSDTSENRLFLIPEVELRGGEQYLLQFQAKWFIEEYFDYVQLLISTGGDQWEALCGRYTHQGNGNIQPDEPLYDGLQEHWVQEEIDLTEYGGEHVRFQFVLHSDYFINLDGFYFDDFKVLALNPRNTTTEEPDGGMLSHFNVFPNPANETLHVALQSVAYADHVEIHLLDPMGRVMSKKMIHPLSPHKVRNTQFNLEGMASGLYFLRVVADGTEVGARRFVK